MFKNIAIAAAVSMLATATFAETKKADATPAPAAGSAEHSDANAPANQPAAADQKHDATANKDAKPAETAGK